MAGLLDGQGQGQPGLLGNLGNALWAYGTRTDPNDMRIKMQRQEILRGLGQGASLGDVATKLFQIGDIEGGLGITRLHDTQGQRDYNRKIDERNHALELEKFNFMRTRKDIPAGFREGTAGLEAIPGGPADPKYKREVGDRQNAPPGYHWNDPTDPKKGMTAIPGGPGEKVDAEVAGRLGLAKSFLGQLPSIRKRVEEGEITGLFDAAQAKMGMGGPGEIRRQIDSGAEALLRMLTGAGMNKAEAEEYVRRYKFHPTDNHKTVLSKLNQLERELMSVGETVGKGRGGFTPPSAAPARSAPRSEDKGPPTPAAVEALRKNPQRAEEFDAKYGVGMSARVLGVMR